MRSIDPAVIAAQREEELRGFFMVRLSLSGAECLYTDCDVPLSGPGGLYQPRAMEADEVLYAATEIVDSTRLVLDNIDKALTPLFLGGQVQGEPAFIYRAVLGSDLAHVTGSPVELFRGEVNSWVWLPDRIELELASILVRWKQRTLARQSGLCRWRKFKGAECGYSGGADWCDRSYDRCVALGNQDNFGGFRFVKSLVDRKIWWGRSPQ